MRQLVLSESMCVRSCVRVYEKERNKCAKKPPPNGSIIVVQETLRGPASCKLHLTSALQ